MGNPRRRSGASGSQGLELDSAPEPPGDTDYSAIVENGHDLSETPVSPAESATATPNESKRSSKKRKVDDSPPWKSATTQTPTSFIGEDGRRKSGRRYAFPLELMPPPLNGATPTRPPTRKSQRQVDLHQPDVSSSASKPRTPAPSSSASKSHLKGKVLHNSPPSRSSNRLRKGTPPTSSRPTTATKTTPSAPSSSVRPRSLSKTTPSKPSTTTRSRRSPAIGTRKSARALKKLVEQKKEEIEIGKKLQQLYANGNDDSDSDLSSFESDGEVEVDPAIKIPKVKLKFGIPKPFITHPSQVLPPKEFESFEDWLNQDDPARTEELREQVEEAAWEEAKLRNRIEHEARHGLLTLENCSIFVPEKQPEPDRQYGHQDHLIAHALKFHKLLMRERREHQELMRKRNVALMAEIKRRRPRTREEIEQEEYTENRKSYKEQIAQLRRKWEEVTKEVERRRIQRVEEERRQAGKEHLNQMLEHSTQLLDARRGDRTGSVYDSDADVEDLESLGEEDDDDEENGDLARVIDEANMSTSESEPDVDGEDDDANLTVEELRAKYLGIATAIPTNLDEMDIDEDDPETDVDMADTRPETGEETPIMPEVDEVDPVLMDDSDESTDMDSGSSDGGMDSSEGEDDEDEDSGLLGFYGGMSGFANTLTKEETLQQEYETGDDEDDLDIVDLVGVPQPPPRVSRAVTERTDTDTDHSRAVSIAATGPLKQQVTEQPEEIKVQSSDLPTEEDLPMEDVPVPDPIETPRITELEDDGITPKVSDETSMTNGKLESIDVETATSTSQLDPKDSGPQSSLTTSPETTPQPHTEVKTPVPFLLRGTLREYQHYGLDWLAGLYDNHTNGILADEMGLGKTIQTIALLSHLACEKGVWGPHLIVVPTSVIMNWEMEFKKWAPGFKILTYYGSREQRAEKRKGWYDTNLWHVCITSYQLVLQDQVTFKRRNWHYLILDEAHNIKNFRSQRWQTLLNFKSDARLLLTGTPLQNNLVELWSLLYFLMPSGSTSLPTGFANLQEFQEWFAHPVDQLIEGGREGMDDEAKRTVTKLHKVLRPYLLRRLKADVEKQMPAKYEHVVYCRLSKRQRYLYDDFMSMAKTRETLASGNYLSIINCLMQLRKVCNHPDLFETRQIVTSFAMSRSAVADYEVREFLVRRRLAKTDNLDPSSSTDFLEYLGLVPAKYNHLSKRHTNEISTLTATKLLRRHYEEKAASIEPVEQDLSTINGNMRYMKYQSELSHLDQLKSCVQYNRIRTQYRPLCSSDLVEVCARDISIGPIKRPPRNRAHTTEWFLSQSSLIQEMIPTFASRAEQMEQSIIKFGCVTPAVVATDMAPIALTPVGVDLVRRCQSQFPSDPFHQARIRLSIAFPDKRLLQYDCGKLQRLDGLLRELQAGGHRALIFTQMTKVLDILEQFLNIHGHRYLRLDGATKVEQRQALTDRFNNDSRIPVFILSTRSGGLGINLTGADTVIFYDLDWNPAMDKQCQDRCHRIGQTRDVHIYRFVSEYTIESNILKKSEQKRMLDDVIIQEGDFTTDYFHKLSIADMLGEDIVKDLEVNGPIVENGNVEKALEAAEDVEDVAAAKVAQKEVVETDVADFADRAGRAEKQRSVTAAATPAAEDTPADIPADMDTEMEVDVVVESADGNRGLGHDIYGEGFGRVEREPEHVDEYMIRQMERELMDVPVVLPDQRKKKKSKKGKKF